MAARPTPLVKHVCPSGCTVPGGGKSKAPVPVNVYILRSLIPMVVLCGQCHSPLANTEG